MVKVLYWYKDPLVRQPHNLNNNNKNEYPTFFIGHTLNVHVCKHLAENTHNIYTFIYIKLYYIILHS